MHQIDGENQDEEDQGNRGGIAGLLLVVSGAHRLVDTVEVESRGPPFVIILIWVNSENAAMVIVMRIKVRVWRRPGQVTCLNCCQVEAPSRAAAS